MMSNGWQFPLSSEIELLCTENYSLKHEQQHIEEKLEAGFEIIKNDDYTLTFDLDSDEDLMTFKSRIGFLERKGIGIQSCEITESKGGNYHAVIKTDANVSISESLRIAIQACLGSDWKREMLGVLRQLNGQKDQVSLLFRPNPLKVIEWQKQL